MHPPLRRRDSPGTQRPSCPCLSCQCCASPEIRSSIVSSRASPPSCHAASSCPSTRSDPSSGSPSATFRASFRGTRTSSCASVTFACHASTATGASRGRGHATGTASSCPESASLPSSAPLSATHLSCAPVTSRPPSCGHGRGIGRTSGGRASSCACRVTWTAAASPPPPSGETLTWSHHACSCHPCARVTENVKPLSSSKVTGCALTCQCCP
mmetsp:Transcript_125635/g.349898  ORF Transcript_125635/g.349898 Transcript_125635/m.349898 type:complete len:213 (-) Transcript_125635:954-1592(-)